VPAVADFQLARCPRLPAIEANLAGVNGNELLALGALAVACIFAAGILLRSWRRRRTRQPLVAAVLVLLLGAGAIALALLGVPYRLPVGAAFIAALVAVMLSARSERGTR
jgi:peptidoglycan/LPS O-acetylase OafA/YrhL